MLDLQVYLWKTASLLVCYRQNFFTFFKTKIGVAPLSKVYQQQAYSSIYKKYTKIHQQHSGRVSVTMTIIKQTSTDLQRADS